MKLNSIFFIFFLISIISACKKSAGNVTPKASIDSLNISSPANKGGVDNLLLNAYGLLDGVYNGQAGATWETGTDNWIYGSVAGGDAHRGSNTTDQTDGSTFENYTLLATNNWLDPKWYVNITGIRYANAAINELPLVKDGSVSPAYAAEVSAEARFLRGFYELELAKLWRNVPFIDEKAVYKKGYTDITNSGAIWALIEADFTAAMNVLPTMQTMIGRPNKYAAEAFLVKTLLFDHKYADAKPLLNDLISNGVTSSGTKYALVPYANNFNALTKNGAEGVFVIQASVHDGSNGYDGNAGDILNFPASPLFNCCGDFQPSFSFVNAFRTDPNTGLPLLDTYNNSDLKNDEGLTSDQPFTASTETVDSRLDWSVGRRGLPYLDWGLMPGAKWISDQPGEGPYVNIKSVYRQAAAATTAETFDGWATNQSTSNGYNEIRYADVLLWAAEVEVEVGSLQNAENYVNMVRTRAADPTGWVHTYTDNSNPMAGFTNTPAANYKVGLYGAAGSNPASGFTTNGQAYARKAVYFERWIELGMEGHRFFDLQRWDALYGGPAGANFMANTLNAYLAHETKVPNSYFGTIFNAKFTAGKNEIYPIPQSQIYLTKGKMVQNPGY